MNFNSSADKLEGGHFMTEKQQQKIENIRKSQAQNLAKIEKLAKLNYILEENIQTIMQKKEVSPPTADEKTIQSQRDKSDIQTKLAAIDAEFALRKLQNSNR